MDEYFQRWADVVTRAVRSYRDVSSGLFESRMYHESRSGADRAFDGGGSQQTFVFPLIWGSF